MLADAMNISVTDEFVFVFSSKRGGISQFSRAKCMPFNTSALIGVGIFTRDEETVAVKNNFACPDILPAGASYIKDVRNSLSDKSVFYFMASNDTVFRLTSDTVKPAFVLNRQNSCESLEGALNPQDDSMFPNDFWVYDFFETSRSFYVRAIYNDKIISGLLSFWL